MNEKVTIVTGAAGALGSVVAETFLNRGSTVIMIDISDKRLEALSDKLNSKRAIPRVADLTQEEDIKELVNWIRVEYGKVDYLVNIAGGFTMGGKMHETDQSTFDAMIDINARTMFNLSKFVLRIMIENNSGKIVNIAARAGLEGEAEMGPYTASKSMVIRLTETMAKEYLEDNINVNCILPGTIDTPRNRQDMPKANFENWVKPSEIADVISFLCSDASRAIKGASIPVYGNTL